MTFDHYRARLATAKRDWREGHAWQQGKHRKERRDGRAEKRGARQREKREREGSGTD